MCVGVVHIPRASLFAEAMKGGLMGLDQRQERKKPRKERSRQDAGGTLFGKHQPPFGFVRAGYGVEGCGGIRSPGAIIVKAPFGSAQGRLYGLRRRRGSRSQR